MAILNENATHVRVLFSFNESVNIKHLLCIRYFSRDLGYKTEQKRVPVLRELTAIMLFLPGKACTTPLGEALFLCAP